MRAKTFTEEQEKFIADHYSDVSDRELADLMNEAYDIGVAARQVATVRKRLGFKKSVLGRPKKAVAEKKNQQDHRVTPCRLDQNGLWAAMCG